MISFDKLPATRPAGTGGSNIIPGRYYAQVLKGEVVKSPNTGDEYLRVTFITKDKESVREGFFVNEKSFNQWKLGKLLQACGLDLKGEGTLNDLVKLLPNRKVIIDVTLNDKGYPELDFSGEKEGVYARDELVMETVEPETVEEPETEVHVASNDEDF